MLEKLTTHLQVLLLGYIFADIADCIREVKLLKKNSRFTEIVPLPKTDPDIKCPLCIKLTPSPFFLEKQMILSL